MIFTNLLKSRREWNSIIKVSIYNGLKWSISTNSLNPPNNFLEYYYTLPTDAETEPQGGEITSPRSSDINQQNQDEKPGRFAAKPYLLTTLLSCLSNQSTYYITLLRIHHVSSTVLGPGIKQRMKQSSHSCGAFLGLWEERVTNT